jgi:membrane protease YdiL (CAAX protease family)
MLTGVADVAHRARSRFGRRSAITATAAVLGVAVAFNIAEHFLGLPLWVGPAMAAALVVFARLTGLSWAQLGLGRAKLGSGLRWGVGAVAVVASVYALGLLLPLTRTAFLDGRYHLSVGSALLTALVTIPVGTVLVEEVLFRSVLWAFLTRHAATWRVLLASSMLFGLWHVLPSIGLSSANQAIGSVASSAGGAAVAVVVVATVLFTAAGGAVAGELRRRSGSILASAGMHWATNSLGVLFGLLAWQLVT